MRSKFGDTGVHLVWATPFEVFGVIAVAEPEASALAGN